MKLNRKKLFLAVGTIFNAGVFTLAMPAAHAQTAAPAADAATPQKIEKIEVTGSRIPQEVVQGDSPVSVVTAQDIKYTGLTSTSDVLNQMPQITPGQGQSISNGATGTATVDIRGLGASRTLVLIDGKRLPAGSPNSWPTNINAIPAPLIQRVEVLSGGASSIYGSDAVAGVVNFIMNDHFEGVQFDWNGNGYNHQQGSWVGSMVADRALTNPAQFQVPGDVGLDGKTQDFSMTLGGNFAGGKGNATVYFEYRNSQPILQSTRDFSSCALAPSAKGYTCGGSSTAYPGRFTDFSNFNLTITNAAGGVRNFNSNLDAYNFNPTNYFQRPDTKYSANFFAHYDATPKVRVYTEFDFMNDKTNAQIAPSGSFLQGYTLNNANPLLSQAFKDAIGMNAQNPDTFMYIGRRNVEGGGRQDSVELTNYRVVIGGKGSVLDDKWDYNAWWQSGKNNLQRTYLNDFSVARLGRAMNVVSDPTTHQPVCASVLDGSDPNCVPYNIFSIGGVTSAALNYLQTPGMQNGYTAQSVVGLTVTSDLGSSYGWKLPWAKEGIGVAFGVERRVEKLSQSVDVEFDTGDLAGQGGATHGLTGQYTVTEGYGEFRLPIMQRQPWAYDLSMNASYRYSNYSTDHSTNSYGIGADWAPIKEVKARGSYQQAVRAANIIEMFSAQGYNLFDGDDPCSGATPSATLAQCQRQGVTAAQYGKIPGSPAGQYNYIQGGNPAVSPETAKTWTAGLVLTPTANISATVDLWNYYVTDVIGNVSPPTALASCVNTGALCDLIHRGPNGNLWVPNSGYVSALNTNLGSYKTSGVDFTIYAMQPINNWGSVGVNFMGTYIQKFEVEQIPGAGSYDCAGLFGPTCGSPYPRWRNKMQGLWNTPWNVNAALTWRYIDGVSLDLASQNEQLAGSYSPSDAHISSQSYFDLALQWNVDKNWTLRGGINNIFDKDPPLLSSTAGTYGAVSGPSTFGNGNTFPQVYDTLGRQLYVSVTAKF